jgi:hypothetical protein
VGACLQRVFRVAGHAGRRGGGAVGAVGLVLLLVLNTYFYFNTDSLVKLRAGISTFLFHNGVGWLFGRKSLCGAAVQNAHAWLSLAAAGLGSAQHDPAAASSRPPLLYLIF